MAGQIFYGHPTYSTTKQFNPNDHPTAHLPGLHFQLRSTSVYMMDVLLLFKRIRSTLEDLVNGMHKLEGIFIQLVSQLYMHEICSNKTDQYNPPSLTWSLSGSAQHNLQEAVNTLEGSIISASQFLINIKEKHRQLVAISNTPHLPQTAHYYMQKAIEAMDQSTAGQHSPILNFQKH